jgi:hypothetical protein
MDGGLDTGLTTTGADTVGIVGGLDTGLTATGADTVGIVGIVGGLDGLVCVNESKTLKLATTSDVKFGESI